jgi:hypothetical protein
MRTLGFLLLMALAGCAALELHPNPLTAEDVIARSKSGASSSEIVDELFRTNTVIPVTAAEIVRLHEAGVPNEVLDFMQYAQLQEIRWRDQNYWYGSGFYRGFGPCPFPPSRLRRDGPWSC